VWIIAALYALLGVNVLSELATAIPLSGGQYNFSRRALGDYAGFVVGWSDWLSTSGSVTAVAMLIGEYTAVLIPALGGYGLTIAFAVIVVFALIQLRGVRWGSATQEVTTLLKTIAFLVIIAACFILGRRAFGEILTESHPGPAALMGWIIALQIVIYAYDGWSGVVYFSEEVKEPKRDIPRSMFGSLALITAIYLLINLGFVRVLPLSEIAGESLAAGTVAAALFGPAGDTILRALVVVAMLSAINAFLLMAPRVLFAMSRDGLFSRLAERVNEGGTPTAAVLISAAVSILFLLSQTFRNATAILSFFFVANYTLSFVSLVILRRKEPDLPRPYRAWGHPWTTFAAIGGSLLFLGGAIIGDTRNSLYALLLLVASYPAFRLTGALRRRSQ
jgi:APA family basic amino acid/polyamine antiporter